MFFVLINFSKHFWEYIRTKNPSYKIVLKITQKNQLNCLKYNMFCSHNFSKNHREYIRTENPSYKIA